MDPTAGAAWYPTDPATEFAPYDAYAPSAGLGMPQPPFQEKVLVPRPWVSKSEGASAGGGAHGGDDDDEYTPGGGGKAGGGEGGAEGKESGTKRGNYRCGRCGQLKKGHVCTNKPRLRTALVETMESDAQAEIDDEMTIRQLDLKLQGYPESYGLTFRWGGGTGYVGRSPAAPPAVPMAPPARHPQQPQPSPITQGFVAPPQPIPPSPMMRNPTPQTQSTPPQGGYVPLDEGGYVSASQTPTGGGYGRPGGMAPQQGGPTQQQPQGYGMPAYAMPPGQPQGLY